MNYFPIIQGFIYSHTRELIHDEDCIDIAKPYDGGDIHLERCHGGGGNQMLYHTEVIPMLSLYVATEVFIMFCSM